MGRVWRAERCRMRGALWSILIGLAMLGAEAIGQTPSLTLIGVPSGALETTLTSVSADGRVAVGYSLSPSERGLSWTSLGGLDPWGFRADVPSLTRPFSVTADGSSIVGQRSFGRLSEGFRYDGTYHALANPMNYDQASANGISGNGQVIAGAVYRSDFTQIPGAVLWNAAGTPELIGRARASDVYASFSNISRDGSTAIGISAPDFNGDEAYSWTRTSGWRHLPVPGSLGADYTAAPNNVNFDGSIIAGFAQPVLSGAGRSVALVWRNGVPTDLGTFGPTWDMGAGSISDDGSVIVGGSRNLETNRNAAVIWLNGSGPINLQDYLASLGVSTPAGWQLASCQGLSADGKTIVGYAWNRGLHQGFVATIPTPSGAAIALFGLTCLNAPRRRR